MRENVCFRQETGFCGATTLFQNNAVRVRRVLFPAAVLGVPLLRDCGKGIQ